MHRPSRTPLILLAALTPVLLLHCTGLAVIVPVRVTGSMSGAADVVGSAPAEFDVPVSVDGRKELASFTDQHTRTASSGGDEGAAGASGGAHLAQAWCQVDGGTTSSGGLRGSAYAYSMHRGAKADGSKGTARTGKAVTSETYEFRISGGKQGYRLSGTVGGVQEAGVADTDARRAGIVRLVSATGVVHEFKGRDIETGADGTFDVAGWLEPGTYSVQVVAQSRAQSGMTPNAEPMITAVQWKLEPLAAGDPVLTAKAAPTAPISTRKVGALGENREKEVALAARTTAPSDPLAPRGIGSGR